jgi:isoprenylcysteine carboxyl methyltransferase (ICMT) family protein
MTISRGLSIPAIAGGPIEQGRGRLDALMHPRLRNTQLDLGSVFLSLLILWFAFVHLRLWIAHPGVFVGLGQVVLELVQGSLLLMRRRDRGGRRPLGIWLAASLGSWAFLLARPNGGGYFDSPALFSGMPFLGADGLWLGMQLFGTLLAIISLACLGRSFGLLAANRGVRTAGAYSIVRHPAYASYMIVQLGYVLENLSLWNLTVFSVVLVAQMIRIHQEEATLITDPSYGSYCLHVRYRLVPGIY